MIDLFLVFTIVCSAILAYLIHAVISSGWFSKIEPTITDSPKFLSKPMTVYYKHRIGPYSATSDVISEVSGIMPRNAITFGIFYDNPEDVPSHLCQAAVGVVYSEDGKDLFSDNYAEQLVRWGYEKMVLPKVGRAVQAVQPKKNILSIFALVYRTYEIINNFLEANDLKQERRMSVEFYTPDQYCVLFPLGDHPDMVVPQYKTREELETALARKHFDSDLSDSESDPEVEEEAAEQEEEEARHIIEDQ